MPGRSSKKGGKKDRDSPDTSYDDHSEGETTKPTKAHEKSAKKPAKKSVPEDDPYYEYSDADIKPAQEKKKPEAKPAKKGPTKKPAKKFVPGDESYSEYSDEDVKPVKAKKKPEAKPAKAKKRPTKKPAKNFVPGDESYSDEDAKPAKTKKKTETKPAEAKKSVPEDDPYYEYSDEDVKPTKAKKKPETKPVEAKKGSTKTPTRKSVPEDDLYSDEDAKPAKAKKKQETKPAKAKKGSTKQPVKKSVPKDESYSEYSDEDAKPAKAKKKPEAKPAKAKKKHTKTPTKKSVPKDDPYYEYSDADTKPTKAKKESEKVPTEVKEPLDEDDSCDHDSGEGLTVKDKKQKETIETESKETKKDDKGSAADDMVEKDNEPTTKLTEDAASDEEISDQARTSALDRLLRFIPTWRIRSVLEVVSTTMPNMADDVILTSLQVPYEEVGCSVSGESFFCTEFNQFNGLYRSPWSNEYQNTAGIVVTITENRRAAFPDPSLLKIESTTQRLLEEYHKLYYKGGLASSYVISRGGIEMFDIAVVLSGEVSEDSWTATIFSIHVISVEMGDTKKEAAYTDVVTFYINLKNVSSEDNDFTSLCWSGHVRQEKKEKYNLSDKTNHTLSHSRNIGKIVEACDSSMSSYLENVAIDSASQCLTEAFEGARGTKALETTAQLVQELRKIIE